MKKASAVFLIAAFLITYGNCFAFAQAVTSADLINKAKNYDGKTVAYRGEAIGDIMLRKDYAWINANDGKNAIGVWIKKELAKDIRFLGGYGYMGDVIEVEGEFHRACPEHGGDMDIHAQTVAVVSQGNKIIHQVKMKKIKVATGVFFVLVILCLFWLFRKGFIFPLTNP